MSDRSITRRLATALSISLLLIPGCQSGGETTRPTAPPAAEPEPDLTAPAAPSGPLHTFSETDLDQYLATMHAEVPDLSQRVVTIGRRNLGQPYEIFLLGEFPYETHDPDPLYCLSRSDCLTFSEHTYAMALSRDWWSFLRALQRLRYRDGVISMVTRNHYTIADWDRNNTFLFTDITAGLGDGQVAVPLTQTCRRARFFERFGLGQDIPDEAVRDYYIPKERLPDALDELRDADFVNIIRGNEKEQYCGHTGLVAIGPDGTVNFLHSARPAVREQPLVEYVNGDRRCRGVKFLRLRPDAEQIIQRELADSSRATDVSRAALQAALDRLWQQAPPEAKPLRLDWVRATHLQGYRLDYDTPVDPELQALLEEVDRELCAQFDIDDEQRACGVLELNNQRLAMIRPDAMFYAASVPKICILAAWLEQHPDAVRDMAPEIAHELGRMIKHSDNALAAKYGEVVGLAQLEAFVRAKQHRFYDEDHGGGLWIGKHYSKASPRVGDPLHDHSHGATVRQCLRFYLLMEQGRLIDYPTCIRMKQIFASPTLDHRDSKFVKGLQGRNVQILRKSGTWQDWHLDTARVDHGNRAYLLVGMLHHPQGAAYLEALADAVDGLLIPGAD